MRKIQIEKTKEEFVLWKNDKFVLSTPKNPHLPKSEGCHLIIRPTKNLEKAWDNSKLCGEAFELASKIAKILIDEKIVDWVNLQYNDNWGLLKGKLSFHVHIYGRKKSGKTWMQPVELPKLPGTFINEPMSKNDIEKLTAKLKEIL